MHMHHAMKYNITGIYMYCVYVYQLVQAPVLEGVRVRSQPDSGQRTMTTT